MTRSLFFAPAVIAASAVAGIALCAMAGWNPHPRDVVVAGAIACLASTLALAPLMLMRGADLASILQAGLAGTVLHLLTFLFLSLGAWAVNLIGQAEAYAIWLLVFYSVSIVPVARIIIRFIRSATPASRMDQPASRWNPPESPSPQPRAP